MLHITCPICGCATIPRFDVGAGDHRILSNWIDQRSTLWRFIECRAVGDSLQSIWYCPATGEQSKVFPKLR